MRVIIPRDELRETLRRLKIDGPATYAALVDLFRDSDKELRDVIEELEKGTEE